MTLSGGKGSHAFSTDDADFETVEKIDAGKMGDVKIEQLTGTEIAIQMKRHPSMEDEERPYVKQKEEEAVLDTKLGLTNQVKMDHAEVVRKDIDELTSSNDYMQINDSILNKMFSMNKLKRIYFWFNLKAYLSLYTKGAFWTTICIALSMVYIQVIASFNAEIKYFDTFVTTCGVLFGGCLILLSIIYATKYSIKFFKENHVTLIRVNLKEEKLEDTIVPLPYGVKLKVSDAFDSKIFTEFKIAYPEVRSEKSYFIRPNNDPAILGITHDNRRFMICWWDIKKDVDRVKMNIKWLKKFKVVV